MTLRLIEGFDYYNDEVDLAGSKAAGFSQTTGISFPTGRDGNALRLGNSDWAYYPLNPGGDVWYVGFAIKINTYNAIRIINFCDDALVQCGIWLQANGSVRAYRGATFILGTSAASALSGTDWQYFEVYAKVANTGGEITVRVDGSAVLTLTSQDTQITGNASANGFVIYGYSGNRDFDDLYACDDAGSVNNGFLGDSTVKTVVPTGAGDSTQWTASTGNNWECVDESPITGTDYVSSSTATHKDLYDVGTLDDESVTIHGLGVTAHGYKTGTGNKAVTLRVKQDTTDNAAGEDRFLREDTQYGSAQYIWEQDPDAAAAWTGAGINTAQLGVELA